MKRIEKINFIGLHGLKIIMLCIIVLIAFTFAACADGASSSSGGGGASSTGDSAPPPPLCEKDDTPETEKFISKWDTTKTGGDNPSENNQIRLPLVTGGTYNFTVEWGDGTEDIISSYNHPAATITNPAAAIHDYSLTPGYDATRSKEYTITISCTIIGWRFGDEGNNSNYGDAAKLLEVSQWGSLNLGDTGGRQFAGAANLEIAASDAPTLTSTTSLSSAFEKATSFNGNLSGWDVSNVTDFSSMFDSATEFNGDIGGWDVSNGTNFSFMFNGATEFNGDIRGWDVSNGTNFSFMFNGAWKFNSPLNAWDVSNATNFVYMFGYAIIFNQPLNNWAKKLDNAENMVFMFEGASSFNQDLSSWETPAGVPNSGFDNGTSAWVGPDTNNPSDAWKPTFQQ